MVKTGTLAAGQKLVEGNDMAGEGVCTLHSVSATRFVTATPAAS